MSFPVEVTLLRALVVENETTNRELLARVLRLHGCYADTAVGVRQALAALGDSPAYDLLIVDLKTEPEDGFELLRQVETFPAGRRPRAIVVASSRLSDYYDRLTELRLQLELFQKPIHLPTLINILNGLRTSIV